MNNTIKRSLLILAVATAVLLLVPAFFPKEEIAIGNEHGVFTVRHCANSLFHSEIYHSASVNIEDILSVETQESFAIGEIQDGTETKKCMSGVWSAEQLGTYLLFAYQNVRPYVIIHTQKGQTDIVMNLENSAVTQNFAQAMQKLIDAA